MRVSDILKFKRNSVYSVEPGTRLSDCVVLMSDCDIGSLPVLNDGQLVGLLTFREIINVLARRQRELRCGTTPPVAELQVRHVMNPEPLVSSPDMDVAELRALMVQHHQRYLPVLEKGRLSGVVSFHDIAKAVLEEQSFENRMLRSYIGDWPVDESVASTR